MHNISTTAQPLFSIIQGKEKSHLVTGMGIRGE